MSGTEVIRYTQIGQEDIRFGTGTFEVVLADGRKVIVHEVDLGAILGNPLLATPPTTALLSDVETGTWTPSLGGSTTYVDRTGKYKKIGNMVTIFANVQVNAIGTGSTTVITGLPFTVLLDTPGIAWWSSSASALLVVIPRFSGTSITFYSTTFATTSISAGTAIFGSGTRVIITGTYFI